MLQIATLKINIDVLYNIYDALCKEAELWCYKTKSKSYQEHSKILCHKLVWKKI